jgi:hypothetical protein
MTRHRLYLIALIGIALFVISTIIGAVIIPNYSSLHQLISESYAIDTTYGTYVRLIGFLPSAILFVIFYLVSIKYLPKSSTMKISMIGLAIFYGLGTVIVSLYPCDSGCGLNSESQMSISQFIHNASAALAYLLVPVLFVMLSLISKQWVNGKKLFLKLIICTIIAIVFIGFIINKPENYLGLYQRIIEFSFLLNLLFIAKYIKSNPST